jgi:uncharacterized LabA/DUF88 family protein
MELKLYTRLSISAGAGKVTTVTQTSTGLSEALKEEIDYYFRAKRIPTEIRIKEAD